MDKFSIEAVDLGQVFKIRIRHDNSQMGADWYLDQVEVVDVDTEEVYMFLCERWLSKKKEDKRIERTFFVKVWNPLPDPGLCLCVVMVVYISVFIVCQLSVAQGYEGERSSDPNSKKIMQAKLGLDRNANKKKKKKKAAVVEEGPG